jgi:hypothetical protein
MTVPPLDIRGLQATTKLARIDQRIGITIYPHADDPVFSSRKTTPRKLNWKKDETEGSIVSFQWSKRIGEPAGNWAATVKLGRNASIDIMQGDVLSGDWVEIAVLRNGIEFPLCIGRVAAVRQDDHSERGATIRTIMLTGADHGGLFDTKVSWSNIYAQSFKEIAFGLYTFKIQGAPGGKPADLFEAIIGATFGSGAGSTTHSAWTLPPGLSNRLTEALTFGDFQPTFLEALDIRKGETRGIYYNQSQLWNNPGETLGQALQRWCNPVLNEWIVDLDIESGPSMFASIHERPFINRIDAANSPWFKLDEYELPEWMIQAKGLGRSDHERCNIIQITVDMSYMSAIEQVGTMAPIFSLNDVNRHGIHPRLESTPFVSSGPYGNWNQDRSTWQRLLADWNAMNPYWLNGPVSAKALLPDCRIGQRFRLRRPTPDRDITAYIEGIDMVYQWAPSQSVGPSGMTALHLTRGWEGTDQSRLAAVINAGAQYVEKT